MDLYLKYWVLGLWFLVWLLSGCDVQRPTGPTTNITGNSGPVTVIVPTGTSNAGSTGPCGASVAANPACPTTTNNTTNNNAAAEETR